MVVDISCLAEMPPLDTNTDSAALGENILIFADGAVVAEVYNSDHFPCSPGHDDEGELEKIDQQARSLATLFSASLVMHRAITAFLSAHDIVLETCRNPVGNRVEALRVDEAFEGQQRAIRTLRECVAKARGEGK